MTGLDTTGKRIKHLREKARLTQEEAAAKVGISQSAFNRYEKDQIRRFTRTNLEKLALALDSTPEFILGTDEQDVRLSHLPEYMQKFVMSEESLYYIKKAYLEYQQDLVNGSVKQG